MAARIARVVVHHGPRHELQFEVLLKRIEWVLQPLAEAQKFCERPSNWVNCQLMANQLKQQKVCCNDPYAPFMEYLPTFTKHLGDCESSLRIHLAFPGVDLNRHLDPYTPEI